MVVVVDINGFSRDMGYNTMTDEYYKYCALDMAEQRSNSDLHRRFQRYQDETKVPIWLQDMGLWETWDIIYSTVIIHSVGYRGEL